GRRAGVAGAVPAPRRSVGAAPAGAGRDDGRDLRPAHGGADRRSGALPGPGPRTGGGDASPSLGGAPVIRRQDDFVAERRPDWDELERLLGDNQRLDRLAPASISRAASLYRAVCADLMRAQGAGYGPDVIELLDALAARGHNALYSAP